MLGQDESSNEVTEFIDLIVLEAYKDTYKRIEKAIAKGELKLDEDYFIKEIPYDDDYIPRTLIHVSSLERIGIELISEQREFIETSDVLEEPSYDEYGAGYENDNRKAYHKTNEPLAEIRGLLEDQNNETNKTLAEMHDLLKQLYELLTQYLTEEVPSEPVVTEAPIVEEVEVVDEKPQEPEPQTLDDKFATPESTIQYLGKCMYKSWLKEGLVNEEGMIIFNNKAFGPGQEITLIRAEDYAGIVEGTLANYKCSSNAVHLGFLVFEKAWDAMPAKQVLYFKLLPKNASTAISKKDAADLLGIAPDELETFVEKIPITKYKNNTYKYKDYRVKLFNPAFEAAIGLVDKE